MNWDRVAPYLFWYTGLAATLTLGALYAAALVATVPFEPVVLVVVLAALLVGPLLAGTTDTGLEAASAGAEAGFGGADPMALQPESLPVPGRAALVFYSLGLAVGGIAALAVLQ